MKMLLWLLLIGFGGCMSPGPDNKLNNTDRAVMRRPADDGAEHSSRQVRDEVNSWRTECGRSRTQALSKGIFYDAGEPEETVIIKVIDLDGKAITNAVLDVYFYTEGNGSHKSNASADHLGIIKFHDPGWFGPDRKAVYVVSAAGHVPRRLARLESTSQELKAWQAERLNRPRLPQLRDRGPILQIQRNIMLEKDRIK